MSKYRRRGRGKGTKCRKKIDNTLRQRVRKIGGDKFGVLVVDSSKKNAEMWLTDFYGEPLWDESRTVPITRGHLDQIMNVVGGSCREHGLKDLVVGIEQTGRYHLPIKRALEKRWEVKTIHPFVTKQLRQPASPGVKTDGVDLEAMTRAIIGGYGDDPRPFPDLYAKWQLINRAREDAVDSRKRLKQRCQERLHAFMPGYPALFRNIWKEPAPLAIAELYGSAKRLLSADVESIRERLREKRIRIMRPTINRVLAWAADAPTPDPGGALNRCIWNNNLRLIEHFSRDITRYERRLVGYLVQTPYVLLLSVPGINVVSASGYGSEVGPITNYITSSHINGRAGLFPSRYQSDETDCADGPMVGGRNARLRDAAMEITKNLILHNDHFQGWADLREQRGWSKKAIKVAIANRFNRIAFHMIAGQTLFDHPCQKTRHPVLKKLVGFSLAHGIKPETTMSLVAKAARQLPSDAVEGELSALEDGLADLRRSEGIPASVIKAAALLLPSLVSQVNHDRNNQGVDEQGAITETPYRVKAETLV
ncbi:MAG: transposase [Lentisphaerae bacterium]|nr:transposase [Lentisphaerota bacterium]